MVWNNTQPRVHRGFLRSWRLNGFSERILDHIRGVIAAHGLDVRSMRCMVTGVAFRLIGTSPERREHTQASVFAFSSAPVCQRRCMVSSLSCEAELMTPSVFQAHTALVGEAQVTPWEARWLRLLRSIFNRSSRSGSCSATRLVALGLAIMRLLGTMTPLCRTRGTSSMTVRAALLVLC